MCISRQNSKHFKTIQDTHKTQHADISPADADKGTLAQKHNVKVCTSELDEQQHTASNILSENNIKNLLHCYKLETGQMDTFQNRQVFFSILKVNSNLFHR